MKINRIHILSILTIIAVSSCAYYNTFFNAKQSYELAQKKRKSSKDIKVSPESKKNYQNTIKKCWKLIDVYGDSSKYAPAALMLIGKSHYQMEEYDKAEHIFEQFIPKYPESDLVPEAKLWLARSYIQQDKDPLALGLLKNFFQENKASKKVAAEVFYVLGELYIKIGDREKAIENLKKCIKIADSEELAGGAQYLIAKNFFDRGEFENAVSSFKKTLKYDIPVMQHYYSLMYVADALDSLKKYDDAEILLKKMLRDDRFKDQFGLIETRLVNIYESQKSSSSFILDSYRDIISRYKKKEGAAAASYSLAQYFEFDLGRLDSAKYYYENVKKEFPNSEIVPDAEERKKLLAEYLTIHNQIVQDKHDLILIARGDSLATTVDSDSSKDDRIPQQKRAETETISTNTEAAGAINPHSIDNNADRKRPTINNNTDAEKKKIKKVVKLRKPDVINRSLDKNTFALGEYFLLKYQDYDSAEAAFKYHINNFNDSLLTPKAYYSLYYLYSAIYQDSVKSDSLKKIIIDKYPKTIYAKKLLGIKEGEKAPDPLQIELNNRYNKAEDYMDQQQYEKAISEFLNVAERDTSRTLGEKAIYAVAYIYEKYIDNVDSAVFYYKQLAEQYPGSKYAKIALNKTKIPEPEKIVSDSLAASDSLNIARNDSLKNMSAADSLNAQTAISVKDSLKTQKKIPQKNVRDIKNIERNLKLDKKLR